MVCTEDESFSERNIVQIPHWTSSNLKRRWGRDEAIYHNFISNQGSKYYCKNWCRRSRRLGLDVTSVGMIILLTHLIISMGAKNRSALTTWRRRRWFDHFSLTVTLRCYTFTTSTRLHFFLTLLHGGLGLGRKKKEVAAAAVEIHSITIWMFF